jgi:hypothetical protein
MPATALLWTTLFIVVFFAVAAYVVISIQRARREQRARSDERAAAMLLTMHGAAAQARPASPAPPAPAAVPAPMPARPAAAALNNAAQTTALTRRVRLLTDTQRLLYLVLRSGMPDHTIMANIRLVDLVDGAISADAIERDARLRELVRERADFLVCNADLVPIAALVIYEAGIAMVPDERIKVAALRELGVKFLRFRADSLPRPNEVRGLILG